MNATPQAVSAHLRRMGLPRYRPPAYGRGPHDPGQDGFSVHRASQSPAVWVDWEGTRAFTERLDWCRWLLESAGYTVTTVSMGRSRLQVTRPVPGAEDSKEH